MSTPEKPVKPQAPTGGALPPDPQAAPDAAAAGDAPTGPKVGAEAIKPAMSETEIRQAGLMVDTPSEGCTPNPSKLMYADDAGQPWDGSADEWQPAPMPDSGGEVWSDAVPATVSGGADVIGGDAPAPAADDAVPPAKPAAGKPPAAKPAAPVTAKPPAKGAVPPPKPPPKA